MVRQWSLLLRQIRLSHIFLTVRIFRSQMIWITYISARITQYTEPSSRLFRIPKVRIWWQTFLHASYPSLLMYQSMRLYTAAFRRMSVLQAVLQQLSARILLQMMFFPELLPCLSGRLRLMPIHCTILLRAIRYISAARYLSGLRKWAAFRQ